MLENDLKKINMPLNPRLEVFVDALYRKIASSNWDKAKKWALCNARNLTKIIKLSDKEKIIVKNFILEEIDNEMRRKHFFCFIYTQETILTYKKDEIIEIAEGTEKVKNFPVYLFFYNKQRTDFIEQEDLKKVQKIKYREVIYEIVAIVLEHKEDFSRAFLIQKDRKWATFSQDKCEWEYRNFSLPWHVSFYVSKKVESE